jgi:cell wall-associated NlpC family hydrolase
MDKSMIIPTLLPVAMLDIKSHAVSVWPFECCGVIIDGMFHSKKNNSPEPLTSYLIDPSEWSDDIEAVIHSHPDVTDVIPSASDMEYQQQCGVPFGIIPVKQGWTGEMRWIGDYTLNLPLKGRQSIHGITDCYALIRAYYWQTRKVLLKEVPRDWDWWYQDIPNLYLSNFKALGFEEIHDNMQVGDVHLMKLLPNTKGPHHAGVVTEKGLMLHHWGSSLSCEIPLGPWLTRTTNRMRYVG